MRLIGLWMTVVLLIAPFDTVAGEGTKGWYLIEPPVDETSKVLFGILDQAPLNQWKRVATTTVRLYVSTNEMKRSKRAETKHCDCQRRRRCQSWRSSKERTATVASQTLASVSLQMTLG